MNSDRLDTSATLLCVLCLASIVALAWIRPAHNANVLNAERAHAERYGVPPAPIAETGQMMRRRGRK